MTAIFGWQDGADVFLIGDSVVSHNGSPQGLKSTFGEATIQDRVIVEEAAIKILELPRGVMVGVSGDAVRALAFLEVLARELRQSTNPVSEIVRQISEIFESGRIEFELLVAYREANGSALLRVRTVAPTVLQVRNEVIILGSLPQAVRAAASRVIGQVRRHGLSPEARLAAAAVHLQSTGILSYLLEHGVGGALFGARLSVSGIAWLADLIYLIYSPGTFSQSPRVDDTLDVDALTPPQGLQYVRVLMREGAGIVISSLGQPPRKAFIPPGKGFSDEKWQQIILAAAPWPFEYVVPCRYWGFLSSRYRKAVFVGRDAGVPAQAVEVLGETGHRRVALADRLVETLEQPVQSGYFDFSIVAEDGTGSTAIGYRLDEAGVPSASET